MAKDESDPGDTLSVPETLKLLIWCWRQLAKFKIGQSLIRDIRGRLVWGFASALHLQLAHQLRDFTLQAHRRGMGSMKPGELANLACGFRNVFAQLLEIHETRLHCTIKLIQANPDNPTDKATCRVVTIARSMPLNRPPEYLPCYYTPAENSGFACLLGCNDPKNLWNPHVYSCFLCNDLTKTDHFVCSRKNWRDFYKCAAIFPLRYMHPESGTFEHLGFLTVDSLDVGILGKVPSTFDYRDAKRDQYEQDIRQCALVQAGGLAADLLATVLLQLMQQSERK